MKVYSWTDFGDDATGHYYRRLGDARRELREYLARGREPEMFGDTGAPLYEIEIMQHTVGTTVDDVVAMLNQFHWSKRRTKLEAWRAMTCGSCDECRDSNSQGCVRKRVVRS